IRICVMLSARHYLFDLFFLGNGDLRVLHSFPTRRSSDLTRSVRIVARDRRFRGAGERAAGIAPLDVGDAARRILPGTHVEGRDADRKSTRLNSSHVATSYAVFCLKKTKLTSYCSELYPFA